MGNKGGVIELSIARKFTLLTLNVQFKDMTGFYEEFGIFVRTLDFKGLNRNFQNMPGTDFLPAPIIYLLLSCSD